MLAEDGSGKGAGLVSAIAQRINARNVCIANSNHKLNGKAVNGNGKALNSHSKHTNGHHNGIGNGANGVTRG
jgi:hypothetical protein